MTDIKFPKKLTGITNLLVGKEGNPYDKRVYLAQAIMLLSDQLLMSHVAHYKKVKNAFEIL